MAVRGRGDASTDVCLEIGRKRVFACALDWPGWCRAGRDEAEAMAALAAYASRYAPVAHRGGHPLPADAAANVDVVERLPGSTTTDFGAPGTPAARDGGHLGRAEAERLAALVAASWDVFDTVAAAAPAALRKGPRGGGRDRDAVVDHVLEAEVVYARKLGVRIRYPGRDDAAGI